MCGGGGGGGGTLDLLGPFRDCVEVVINKYSEIYTCFFFNVLFYGYFNVPF